MADTTASSKLTQVRVEYSDLNGIWVYNRDVYDNLGGVIDGTHLIAYVRETPEGFERRKTRCWFPNFAKDVVTTLSGHLFKKPAVRELEGNKDLEVFAAATDRLGEVTLQEFMKQLDVQTYVFGYAMVLVDKPAIDVKTKKDEQENGRPYAYIISPLDMLDWEMGDDGSFKWVKLQESYRTNADDPLGTHDVKVRYRIWTREGWTLYNEDESIVEQGEHTLGRVPIIMVKHDKSLKYETIGTSTFTSITQLSIRMFNAISERDNILLGSTFPLLTIPTTDTVGQKAATDDTTSEKNDPALGTGSVLTFDPESRHAPAFINHDGKTVENYNTLIDSLIKQIQQLARLEFTGGTYTSGVAMAFDFEKTNQALKAKAEKLKDTEMSILRLVNLWMNNTDDIGDVSVTYPEDYNIMDVMKELDAIFKKLELNVSSTFDKEVRKQASRRLLPAIAADVQAKIDDEIEEGVKPIDEFIDEGDE